MPDIGTGTTYKNIWDTLSRVNVNQHTEEKNGLTYLSWAWAWGTMMEHFPHLTVEWAMSADEAGVIRDAIFYPGGTASVQCRVTIDECSREMWLPMMDHKNKAIMNPDARAISDTKMRCLVKCFALFGLGFYIYAGEDLPTVPAPGEDPEKLIADLKALGARLAEASVKIEDHQKDAVKKAIKTKDVDAMKALLAELTKLLGD